MSGARSSSYGYLLDDSLDLDLLDQSTSATLVCKRPLVDPLDSPEHDLVSNQELESSSGGEEEAQEGKPTLPHYTDSDAYQPTGFGEGGLFMRNKRKKLKVQHEALRELDDENGHQYTQIFKGLRVYINGLTETVGMRQISEGLTRRGGEHVPYLDRKGLVTHIVASELTLKKRQELREYKVATPAWLLDSIAANKLLDWRLYSLFTPSNTSLKSLGFDDERGIMGRPTQKSLFSVGVSTTVPASPGAMRPPPFPPPKKDPPPKANKPLTETHESLSERGERLAAAALALPSTAVAPSGASFFAPRAAQNPAPLISVPFDATTDSMSSTENPYLPSKGRSEHAAALLSDPEWLARHTSQAPGFVKSYFESSRLHHLSTWKEELKLHVAALQAASARPVRTKKLTGTPSDNRTIFHVDFDSFFVSAGLTKRPELRGKPVAVCHGGQGEGLGSTSEIASCSYEARAKGVKNGISLGKAREMCPEILTLPFDFELYEDIATKFYGILLGHADYLQAVSIDEILMEVKVPPPSPSGSVDPSLDLANRIRAEILAATGCQASIGISHNILLARLATRRAKPASAFHILPDAVDDFLADLPVRLLPGVGWSMEEKMMEGLKVETVGQLRNVNRSHVQAVLGPGLGSKFQAFARGVDPTELDVGKPRQSVSAEINYGIRFVEGQQELVKRFIRELGEEIASRLRKEGYRARHLTLKILYRSPSAPVEAPKFLGHGHCETVNAASTLSGPGGKATDDADLLGDLAWKLLASLQIPIHELRGVGITVTKLEKNGIPVDTAREKDQPMLSFAHVGGKAPKHGEPPVALDSDATSHGPPTAAQSFQPPVKPLVKKPSVIVLSDSDEDACPAPALLRRACNSPSAPARKPSKAPKKLQQPKVAPIFSRAASTAPVVMSKEQLEELGIDPEYFEALSTEDQREVVAQQRRNAPSLKKNKKKKAAIKEEDAVRQSRLESQVSKPAVSTITKLKAQTAHPSASPGSVTNQELMALGIDPSFFHALPEGLQKEQLDDRYSRVIRSNTTAPKSNITRRTVTADVAIPKPWAFQKLTEIDDLRDKLELWVIKAAAEGPNAADVDALVRFLGRCVDRSRGQDLEKAVGILRWWRLLLNEEIGDAQEHSEAKVQSWWTAYERARETVATGVAKDWGSVLVV